MRLIRHNLGFYQLKEIPAEKDLVNYYTNKYFQENHGNYRSSYTKDEIDHFRIKNEQKYYVISKFLNFKTKRFLDIGCGEGFSLNFFIKKGWDVLGLDHSNHSRNVIVGDIFKSIENLRRKKRKFDVINLSNVLEHVRDPILLLKNIKNLANNNTILIITVPNDFSFYQNFLLQKKLINKKFWIVTPDHISYFTSESLKKICNHSGWLEKEMIADFPVDIFLSNPYSNYLNNQDRGRAAHEANIKLDYLFHNVSISATINFYKAMADLGFGRQITGYFKKIK